MRRRLAPSKSLMDKLLIAIRWLDGASPRLYIYADYVRVHSVTRSFFTGGIGQPQGIAPTAHPKVGKLLHSQFLQQSLGVAPAVHHVDHVADVYADGAGQHAVEEDIRGQGVPVAVECEANQSALTIEER